MSTLSFKIETWTELGTGCLFVIIRTCVRWKIVGIRGFRADDYMIVLMVLLWASATALTETQARLGSISTLSAAQILALDPPERNDVELGGKIVVVSWMLYASVVWLAKTCLLCYYNSFTTQIWHQGRLIKIAAVLVGSTYIIVISTILGHCRPIQNLWRADQVPSYDCQYGYTTLYTTFICNLLTDLFLLVIPAPILFTLFQVTLSLARKILLALFVCTGIFTIAASIASFAEVFQSSNDPTTGAMWVSREKFVWTILLCAPTIASIFRREFWSNAHKTNSRSISQQIDMDRRDTTVYSSGEGLDKEDIHMHLS